MERLLQLKEPVVEYFIQAKLERQKTAYQSPLECHEPSLQHPRSYRRSEHQNSRSRGHVHQPGDLPDEGIDGDHDL